MAENMMFNMATELFVEGRFAYGLWYAEPEILRVWNAIGQYNRFFADNKEYYRGARSLATLAIVLDNRSEGEADPQRAWRAATSSITCSTNMS